MLIARQSGGWPLRFIHYEVFRTSLGGASSRDGMGRDGFAAVIQLHGSFASMLTSGSSVRHRADSRSFASKYESATSAWCEFMIHVQKYLAQASRQIAELAVQIAARRVVVKHALDMGQRSDMAESLLDALERSLRIFEKHRIFLLGVNSSASAMPPRHVATSRSLPRGNGRA